MVQPAIPPRAAQERIGRYEVLRRIATGGMAELFLAKHVGMEGFEKVVAIKRILAHLAHDDEFVNMFRDEARLVAKLSHPNIVQIYDLGKSADSYFIAMEYIPGRNLASISKKCRQKAVMFPALYIARAMAQACEALHYAHTRIDIDGRSMGIVHRDVSPQNIILSFSGAVKLVDFGIAKAATKIAHTRAGVLKGKYAYMSPEQIKGEEIDARSDLFSVGIVLFELLCGKRPFEKENSIQTLKAIVQDAHADPRSVNPAVPDGIAEIIHRALTKDRNQRYQSAQEVQLALEDYVSSTGERANAAVVGDWVTQLFDDELDRGKGGVVQLKGGGEVILPASEKMERSDRDDVAIDEEDPEAEAEDVPADEPPEVAAALPGGSIRGGGSVMGRGASVPGERLRLLEEGVIGSRSGAQARDGDEEATAIASDQAEVDEAEAAAAVGPAAPAVAEDRRPLYEEGVRGRVPAPQASTYDDDHTELAGAGGPVLRGPPRDVPAPTIDLQAPSVSEAPRPVRIAAPVASSSPTVSQRPNAARTPEATPAPASAVVAPPKVAPSLTPAKPAATLTPPLVTSPTLTPAKSSPLPKFAAPSLTPAKAGPASAAFGTPARTGVSATPASKPPPRTRSESSALAPAAEAPLDLGIDDSGMLAPFGEDVTISPGEDPWGDKTTTEEGEDYTPDGGVVVRDAPTWGEPTQAEGRSSFGRRHDVHAFRASEPADPWGDKTSANVDDPAENGERPRVAVFDATDDHWGDKTVGVTDALESDSGIGFGGDVAIDATAGMSIEEIAAKLNSARGEKTSAMPALFADGQAFGADSAERTEWGTSGREVVPTDEWDAAPRRPPAAFDEDALPAGVDRDRNVELDSSTVAATASDYVEEGLELGVAAAFAYDEPTFASTSEVESAAPPARPKNALGAIRLAKVAALPLGGIEEVSGAMDEPTSEFGTEQFSPRPPQPPPTRVVPPARPVPAAPSAVMPPFRSMPSPPARGVSSVPSPPARGVSSVPSPPARGASGVLAGGWRSGSVQPLGKSPLDVPSESGEGTYNEPVLPPGGAILGDFDLEALLAPAPAALAPPDPMAGIGSTRVPPASVSLSEMLLERSELGGATTKPRPPVPRGASLPPAPLKSAAMIRGASVAGSAPSRPPTVIRAIKETSRRPGTASASPPGGTLPPLDFGTPADGGALAFGGTGTGGLMTPGYNPMATPAAIPLQLPPPPPRARARMTTAQLVTIVLSCVVIAVVLGAIGYVKLRPPSLEIRTTPVGARVFLGGQLLEGLTPLSVPIEPDREYTIRIVREGYEDHQGTVRIPRDKKAWMASFTLKAVGVVVPMPAPSAPQ